MQPGPEVVVINSTSVSLQKQMKSLVTLIFLENVGFTEASYSKHANWSKCPQRGN